MNIFYIMYRNFMKDSKKAFWISLCCHLILIPLFLFAINSHEERMKPEQDLIEIEFFDLNGGGGSEGAEGGASKSNEATAKGDGQALPDSQQAANIERDRESIKDLIPSDVVNKVDKKQSEKNDLNKIEKNNAQVPDKVDNTSKIDKTKSDEKNMNSSGSNNAGSTNGKGVLGSSGNGQGKNGNGQGNGNGKGKSGTGQGSGQGSGNGTGQGNGSGQSNASGKTGGPKEYLPPQVISSPKPKYPPEAREKNITGQVRVRMQVLANGSVGSVSIAQSSGHSQLDQAALDAARKWRFAPAKVKGTGEAVDSYVTRTLTFKMN